MQFWNFLAIRLIQAFVVVFIVVTVVFVIARVVGNPVTFLVDQSTATNEEIEAIKERFGLNDSIPRQYVNFVWEIAQLDFGHSFRGTSTIDAIGDRAVNTFKLGAAGLVFALAWGSRSASFPP